MDTGQPVSAEALLRLRDETGALLTPDRFIGIAEETGLIAPMGRWVIREACRQLTEWRAAGLEMRRVAVNVSPRQLLDEALIPTIRTAVHENGLAYADLELELTEALVIENLPVVSGVLREIDSLGVHLSVDDFGTGYSGLAYLARLPLKRLKVDRSFVQGAVDDPRAGEIVRAVVTMARQLRLQVTAEGIETEAQRRLVAESGCELGQGFLMARPMPPSQLLPD
jgi:EAL domain-containing protein (putative c-di-GMP-specific phosphodiesterase class I)